MTQEREAILSILFAGFLFTIMGMFVKILTPNLPAMEIVFARNLFGLIWIIIALFLNPPKTQQGGKPFVLFFRGFAGGSAMMAYFYNMSIMPLGTAFAFSATSPIFLALLGVIFAHQNVSLKVWMAIFIGFFGILLISNPMSLPLSLSGLLLGIYSGLGAALAYLSIAKLAKNYDTRVIIASLMLSGSMLPLLTQFVPYEDCPIALFEKFVMPSFWEWILIIGLGIVSTYAQIYLTRAYSMGNPPIIGAMSYMTIFMATFAGILLGDKIPSIFVVVGMFLIAFGGSLVAFVKK